MPDDQAADELEGPERATADAVTGDQAGQVEIRNNADGGRYELSFEGAVVGLADYRQLDDVVVISHVEVDPAYGGRGLAGELTRFALDDLRSRAQGVWPVCPYVRAWIGKHPEYLQLVPEPDRARFGL